MLAVHLQLRYGLSYRDVEERFTPLLIDADYPFTERRHINAIAIRFQLDYNQMISDWAEWATAQTDSWNDITDPNTWDWHAALT